MDLINDTDYDPLQKPAGKPLKPPPPPETQTTLPPLLKSLFLTSLLVPEDVGRTSYISPVLFLKPSTLPNKA